MSDIKRLQGSPAVNAPVHTERSASPILGTPIPVRAGGDAMHGLRRRTGAESKLHQPLPHRNASLPARPGTSNDSTLRMSQNLTQSGYVAPTASDPHAWSSGAIDLVHQQAKPSRELSGALDKALAALSTSSLLRRRPQKVKDAAERLKQFAAKPVLTLDHLKTLIDISLTLRDMPAEKSERLSVKQRVGIDELAQSLSNFIGTSKALHARIGALSSDVEKKIAAPSFEDFLKESYPEFIRKNDTTGEYELTAAGRVEYDSAHAIFVAEKCRRHTISANPRGMNRHDANVKKLIEAGFSAHQQSLRNPAESLETKKTLIEVAAIIHSLATATPERISRTRRATVFPGGVTDPRDLVPSQQYQEPGFVFVGSERASDRGHRMKIQLSKGIPVDASNFYGHSSRERESKLQWVTLPGARFRYEGVQTNAIDGTPTYLFSQVDR